MNALLEAIDMLEQSVDGLETVAKKVRARMDDISANGVQHDMFTASVSATNVGSIDPAVLARKLDIAIERVEQVLREG